MAAPVVVEWIVKGIPDVLRASKNVGDAVLASERAATRALQREAGQRAAIAKQEANARVRGIEQSEKAKERAMAATSRWASQAVKKDLRDLEQGERAKTRAVEQEEKRRLALRDNSARMAGRFAIQQVEAEQRAREKAAREDLSTRRRFATTVMGAGAAAGRNVARGLGRGASYLAGTVAQLGGGFSVADAVNERSQLERQSILLANKAILPGGARADKGAIMSKVKASSIETGTDQAELLKAWGAYTDATGDFKGGEKNLGFFGKLSKATGADLGDIAKTAGQLKVQNKDLGEPEMKQLLLNTVAAGRSGSVDMPELARHARDITKTASSYAGDQAANQQKLLGLSQIGVRTGSVSEASTMLSNISGDASKHHGAISALLGPGTFTAKGQIAKGPDEFLADVLAKTGGNRQKIQGLGFGQRSLKMFDALLPGYNEAEKKALAGGANQKDATAAAKAATLADMKQFTGATMTEESLNKDFAEVMKSSAEQFEGAVRAFKTEIGEKLLPEFLKLIPILQKLVPPLTQFMDGMIKIANWAMQNPLAGLAAAISIAFAVELGKAKIADIIKNILAGKGGALPVPGGSKPAFIPDGGVVKKALGLGVAAGVVAGNAELKYAEGEEKAADLAAQVRSYGQGNTKTGMSAELAAKEVDNARKRLDNGGVVSNTANLIGSLVSDESSKAYAQYKSDQAVVNSKDLIDAIKETTAAIKASATPGAGPAGRNPALPITQRPNP